MPQGTLEAKLEVRRGALAQTFPLFDPSTLQEANGIMARREPMPEIRNEWLWTADFSMYRVEGGEAFLYFAPREHNLIFRDVDNATTQLSTNGNYIPPKEGIDEVVAAAAAGKALKVKISDLQLQKHNPNDHYGFFDVNPDDTGSLNPSQRLLVQAIYGASKPGNRVYVLDSEYVKNTLRGKEESAIARASWLDGAFNGSWFSAVGRYVGDANLGLLGVLKEAPKAPQKK